MKCEETKVQLSAYLDGEVSSEQAELIRAHLAQCPRCADEFRVLAATWDALLADSGLEPSPDFARKFWQKAGALANGRPSPSAFFRLLKWSPAMAAGLALAFLAGWFSAGGLRPDEPGAAQGEIAFLRDYEMIQQMDLLEDLPALQVADLNNGEGGDE